jgi:hypothetical protein
MMTAPGQDGGLAAGYRFPSRRRVRPEKRWAVSMTGILANAIRALKRIFIGDMRDLFNAPWSVEISLPAETIATIDNLKARYSIEIALPGETFSLWLEHGQYLTEIEGQAATSEEASWYIPLFAEEFGLYPPLLVEKAKLGHVVLCGELSRSQKPKRGAERFAGCAAKDRQPLSFVHVPCGGVPDGQHGVLYLDVTCGRDDQDYMRKMIHHEFYHCVQQRQFGGFGDGGWAALNSPDFVYGPGGLAAIYGSDRTFWVMPAEEWGNGFLNHYSMSAPEEDQAEIFAHLLTEPARLEARVTNDDILRSKVERLKASLERFCPAVSAQFWQRVEESRWPFGF